MDRMKLLQYMARVLAMILCLGCFVLPAAAAKRLALVIGNSDYQDVANLRNPVNDAKDISAKLSQLGFEVQTGIDLTRYQFINMVSDFRARINFEKAEDVVFYYAGHGFNLYNHNQLVPIDAQLKDRNLILLETVRLDDIMTQIQVSENQKTVILLDACRNSPLPPALQTNDTGSGLAMLEINNRTANALVIFATLPNQVTKDGKGRNSPFAHALLKYMGTPDKSIDAIFPEIRRDIMAETNDTQRPFKQGSPPAQFYFNPEPQIALNTPPQFSPRPQVAVSALPKTLDEKPTGDLPVNTSPHVITPNAIAEGNPAAQPADIVQPLKPVASDILIGVEVAAPQTQPQHKAVEQAVPPPPPPEQQASVPPALLPSQSMTVSQAGKKAPLVEALHGASALQEQQARSLAARPTERSDTIAAQTITDIVKPSPSKPLLAATRTTGKTEQIASLGSAHIRGIEIPDAEAAALGETGSTSPQTDKQIANLPPVPDKTPVVPTQPDVTLIVDLQKRLTFFACYTGNIDGVWGDQSKRALTSYLKKRGRGHENAEPTQQMLASLKSDTAKPPVCTASIPPHRAPKHLGHQRPPTPPAPARQPPPPRPKVPIIIGG